MPIQETYTLNGPTEFYFPHPVQHPEQLVVEIKPGSYTTFGVYYYWLWSIFYGSNSSYPECA